MSMFKKTRDPYQVLPARAVAAVASPPPPPVPAPAAAKDAPSPSTEMPYQRVDASAVAQAVTPVNREAAAVVDRRSKVKGTLHSEGNVLIEGCFEGEIEAKETVWVDKGAQTQAQLRANDVVISGTFGGEIDCRHRLQIAASATVTGEIRTPVLVIEEGATVNCRFSMAKQGGGIK